MSHLPTYDERNGRHRATCPCGWETSWLSSRYDVQHLARVHADHERTKGD